MSVVPINTIRCEIPDRGRVEWSIDACVALNDERGLVARNYLPSSHSKRHAELEAIIANAKLIPDSNGSNYYNSIDCRVAIVTDEFLFNYYKDAFKEIVLINYADHKTQLTSGIDLFLIVSLWYGFRDSDWKGIGSSLDVRNRLTEVISYAKAKGIKTAFQTIEDPSNFETFISIAQLCDHIFT